VKTNGLVLGLDLGSTSIGWSLAEPGGQRVVRAGVRIFDPGVELEKFERGEEGSSNNVVRRTARLHRRQLRRREGRHHELFSLLQRSGLLPTGEDTGNKSRGEIRHAILTALDSQLMAQWRPHIEKLMPQVLAPDQVLPFGLRTVALDRPLKPYELGRAIYHLAQRRGFKSNRRESRAQEDRKGKKPAAAEERSKVKQGIQQLTEEIRASGARTLGEFFSRLDPAAARIRDRWTSRQMYLDEFEQIWAKQAEANPAILTPALKAEIHNLIFFQRPIAEGKPGQCELEPDCQRAPMASLEAQRFRLLQKVNDLEVRIDEFTQRKLSPEQTTRLLQELENQGDLTFAAVRQLLGFDKKTRFNLERGGEKKLPGNRTAAIMRQVFGASWDAMAPAEQRTVVEIWRTEDDEDKLAQIGSLCAHCESCCL
jgi:CRISPR-associated endonuclease Csn1